MTTTTSTTSTTAASATATATQQLLSSLDTGSGVDTASLVTSLVTAQFASKTAALTAQNDTLTSQISGVGTLKNTITAFASALQSLVTGGTLTTQPVSSDSAVLTATALPGAKIANLSRAITVSQLAAAQTVRTTGTDVHDRTAVIGSGSFTLNVGPATYDADGRMTDPTKTVTISVTNASLDDIAGAITNSGAGVTATVVTDADGTAYLSMKGQTGAASAFTLTTDDAALSEFQVGPNASGTQVTSAARDARLSVDGIAVSRASNTISDLIDGVSLQLTGTSPTAAGNTTPTPVSLTSTKPTAALTEAVNDFVETYNQVLSTITPLVDPVNGALKSDSAAQSLLRSLSTLTATPLLANAASGTPTSLSEIGIATNRDGTLTVNSATLTNALALWPDSVEAIFGYTKGSTDGIAARLNTLSTAATDTNYGLGASSTRYTAQQADVATQQADVKTQSDDMTTRLTQQFATMNSKVAAYKSTQTFLKNQIDAWNNSNKN